MLSILKKQVGKDTSFGLLSCREVADELVEAIGSSEKDHGLTCVCGKNLIMNCVYRRIQRKDLPHVTFLSLKELVGCDKLGFIDYSLHRRNQQKTSGSRLKRLYPWESYRLNENTLQSEV